MTLPPQGYMGSQGLNNDNMAYWVVLMRNLDNKIMMYVPLHIVGLHRFPVAEQ